MTCSHRNTAYLEFKKTIQTILYKVLFTYSPIHFFFLKAGIIIVFYSLLLMKL